MTSQLMEPIIGDDYEPTEDEIREYAQALGFILPDDDDLLYIAREGLKAPLPNDWRVASTAEGDIYYYHKDKREPTWDHPMDEFYRNKFLMEKEKKTNGKTNVLKFTKMTLPKETTEENLINSPSNSNLSQQRTSVEGPSSLPQLSVINLTESSTKSDAPVNETKLTFDTTTLIELSKQHAKELADLSKAHSATIAELCDQNAKEMMKLREEHSEGIKKMKRDLNDEYKKEYGSLRKEFESKVTELREAHEKQMKKLDDLYSDEVRQAKQKYDHLLSDRDGYERRINNLKVEQSKLISVISELEKSIADLKSTSTQLTVQQRDLQTRQTEIRVQEQNSVQRSSPSSALIQKVSASPKTLLHIADLSAFSGLGNFIVYCLPDPARSTLLSEVLRLRVIEDFMKQEKKRTDLRVKAVEARRAAFITQSKVASEEANAHGAFQVNNPAIKKIYEERKQIDAESREVNRAISTYRQASDWLSEKKTFTNLLLRFIVQNVSKSDDLLATLAELFNEYTDVFENRINESFMSNLMDYNNGRLSVAFIPLNALETPDARSARESKAEPGPSRKQKESYIRGKVLELLQIGDYKVINNIITRVYGTMPSASLGGSPDSLSSSVIISHLSTAINANNACCGRIVRCDGDFYIEKREQLPTLIAKLWGSGPGMEPGSEPGMGPGTGSGKVPEGKNERTTSPSPHNSPKGNGMEKKKVIKGEEYISEKGQKIVVPVDDLDFVVMIPDAPPPGSKSEQRHRRRFSPEVILMEKEKRAREASQVKAPSKWLGEYRAVTKGYA